MNLTSKRLSFGERDAVQHFEKAPRDGTSVNIVTFMGRGYVAQWDDVMECWRGKTILDNGDVENGINPTIGEFTFHESQLVGWTPLKRVEEMAL